jgi:hypothetical protein
VTAPNTPTLEPILRLGLTLGPAIEIGSVPEGDRVVTTVLGGAAPAEVIDALDDPDREVDPATYYFRGTLRVSTAVPKFTYLNRALVVTSGSRSAEAVVLDAFLVT